MARMRAQDSVRRTAEAFGLPERMIVEAGRVTTEQSEEYRRWRGGIPRGWRPAETPMGLAYRLGAVQVMATLEPVGLGEHLLLVSVSRSDRREPTALDIAAARAAFIPEGLEVGVSAGGERMPLVYLTTIVPDGVTWPRAS
jgi:hypothetical protein